MADRVDFAWLKEPRGRRSALCRVHTAVRHGWLDAPELAPRRAKLIDALAELLDDPGATDRERMKTCRIVLAMAKHDGPS